MTSPVIAVGRVLQPKHGEPRILHRVRINRNTSKAATVTRMILQKTAGA